MKNNCMPVAQGIYKIINTVNLKFYIGSTTNLKQRKAAHLSCLRGGYHYNNHLQNSFNKHGESCFVFEILEVIPKTKSLDDVRDIEQSYLDKVENWDLCFNVNKFVQYLNISPLSKETKIKMSESRKGAKNPNYGKNRSQKIKRLLHEANRVSGAGVYKTEEGNYRAEISIFGVTIYLGRYKTKEEALKLRILAENYYWHEDESLAEFFKNLAEKLTKTKELPVGVHYISRINRYSAQLKVNRKTTNLGCFKTPEEALERRLLGEKYYWEKDLSLEPLFRKKIPAMPKGVSKNGNRYSAYIQENGKRKYLGNYETVDLAVKGRENYIKKSSPELTGEDFIVI
jgi:group I intron endonuclease